MPIDLHKRGPAITDADIDAFEARIGGTLPHDYRAFLLNYNGGRPEHHVIRNPETGDLGVQIFFGIWDKEYFDIDAANQAMEGRWPSRFMTFAIGDCGDFYCLSLGPPDYGSVYFWDHEQESEADEEPTELNLYHVADSFAEFWERIEPISQDEYLAEKELDVDSGPESSSSEFSPPPDTNGEPA